MRSSRHDRPVTPEAGSGGPKAPGPPETRRTGGARPERATPETQRTRPAGTDGTFRTARDVHRTARDVQGRESLRRTAPQRRAYARWNIGASGPAARIRRLAGRLKAVTVNHTSPESSMCTTKDSSPDAG